MRKPLAALILLGTLLLAACGEPEPVRIGFLGGLSDRNTDVGDAGRNGVILAVEQWNREGGIQGRPIELIARDDAQKAETAARAAAELGQDAAHQQHRGQQGVAARSQTAKGGAKRRASLRFRHELPLPPCCWPDQARCWVYSADYPGNI